MPMETGQNYEMALQLARQAFAGRAPGEMASRAGAQFLSDDQAILIRYLNRMYRVAYPGGEVQGESGSEGILIGNRILILHYLASASGAPMENRLISYRELPAGNVYYNAFARFGIAPLAEFFGNRPELLQRAGAVLGATVIGLGNVGLRIPVLPGVPVTVTLWEADDEFPASANILFDASASSYLHTEDLAYVGEYTSLTLRRIGSEVTGA